MPARTRVAVAVLLSLLSLSAAATDWQLVADTSVGKLKLDPASVKRQDAYTRALLVYEFKDQQKIARPPYDVFDRREDAVLVDCAKPTLGVAAATFFDGAKQVGAWSLETAQVRFTDALPDTMAEKVVKAVCAVGKAAGK